MTCARCFAAALYQYITAAHLMEHLNHLTEHLPSSERCWSLDMCASFLAQAAQCLLSHRASLRSGLSCILPISQCYQAVKLT